MRRCAAVPKRADGHLDGAADIGARALHLGRDLAYRLGSAAHQGFHRRIGAEHHQPDACRGLPGAIDEIQRLGDGLPGDAAGQIEREHHVGMARPGAGERPRERDHQRGEGQHPQHAGGDAA